MSAKLFPTDLVASVAVGVAITNTVKLSGIHGLVEHVLGHPVWSHEVGTQLPFASAKLKPLFADMGAPSTDELRRLDVAARQDILAHFYRHVTARFGETMEIEQGSETRSADPLTTAKAIFPNAQIMPVIAP